MTSSERWRKTYGLEDKFILLCDGLVLDGRNRLACRLAGIEPKFEQVDGLLRTLALRIRDFSISVNFRRRQLRPGQQALAAAAALHEWKENSRRCAHLWRGVDRPDPENVPHPKRSIDELGKLFGISGR